MNNTICVLARRVYGLTALAFLTVGESTVGVVEAAENASERNILGLEEIVVTAQKREERLQDVPMSISVLTGDGLDKSTVRDITEVLRQVPGVAVQEGFGGLSQVQVRGVTAPSLINRGPSPTAYYLDGVPFGFVKQAFGPDPDAYDLERVEV